MCHGLGDPAAIHSDTETQGLSSPGLDQVGDLLQILTDGKIPWDKISPHQTSECFRHGHFFPWFCSPLETQVLCCLSPNNERIAAQQILSSLLRRVVKPGRPLWSVGMRLGPQNRLRL